MTKSFIEQERRRKVEDAWDHANAKDGFGAGAKGKTKGKARATPEGQPSAKVNTRGVCTDWLKNGKKVQVRKLNNIKDTVKTSCQEMSRDEIKSTYRKVFYKLEKFWRLRKLERMLGLYEMTKQ